MVDSISNIGGPKPVESGRAQAAPSERREARSERREAPQSDRVELSQEALSLAQAEEAAREVARELASDQNRSLGLDADFDKAA